MVGSGINPRWNLDEEEIKEELQLLWEDSSTEMDAYGVSDIYGLEEQTARSMFDGGATLARFRPRYMSDGLVVPLQVQLLESDHLDASYNTIAPNGNQIRQGIEWNALGQRVAYWLLREHPGEYYFQSLWATGDRVRVDAADVLHVYRPLRIGQAHGVPWMASIIVKLNDIDQYDDAEVVRKKSAAMWGGFFTNTPSQSGSSDAYAAQFGKKSTDSNDRTIIAMEPGTFTELQAGQEVQFSEPADVGGNYQAFMRQQFLLVARGIGITYEQLTGDLANVNYSSIRAGLIEFRRLCETIQLRTLVFQFCRPIADRWLTTAVMSGATKKLTIKKYLQDKRKYHRITWVADGWDYVDPLKDVMSDLIKVRAGFESREAIVSLGGKDILRIDKETILANSRADQNGLIHDSDPRKTEKSGAMQQAEDKTIKEAIGE